MNDALDEGIIYMKIVLIIGAGPAGLTAAYELLNKDKGFKVVILEETDTVGGFPELFRSGGTGWISEDIVFSPKTKK